MSLLSKIADVGRSILSSPVVRAIAPVVGGPIGLGVAAASTAYSAYKAMAPAAPPPLTSMPGAGFTVPSMSLAGAGMGLLPALGTAAGTAVRYGRAAYRSAVSYCKRHPGWCQTIGGIAAVEAMVSSGQLPAVKSRRGRGITATELKNFRRVARFTSKYCAPVRRAMSSKAVRGGKSCR